VSATDLTRRLLAMGAVGGVVLGAAYTLAPLTVLALLAGAVLLAQAARRCPPAERRAFVATLSVALGARVLAIAALAVAGAIRRVDPRLGQTLTGDEAYVLGRALRTRDIVLGAAVGKYDYVVAFDEYGRNSYLRLLGWLETTFGPTPYGMRVLNAVMFVTACVLLVSVIRRAFGRLPASAALVVMLFYPTLFVWSISLLKEPLYLLGMSLILVSAIPLISGDGWRRRAAGALGLAAGLAVVADLRPGAVPLAAASVATGVVLREVARRPWRLVAAAAIVAGLGAAVVVMPSLRRTTLGAIGTAAKQHAGHVFTVGHPYKTLDEGFYVNPQTPRSSNLTLTADQAARYVLRSAVSFVLVPLPWQLASARELVYLPEQLVWYVVVAFALGGVVVGWRRDSLVTGLLVGFVVPTAAALALTNGNVGTVLRLRGVVIPYLAALAALGWSDALDRAARRRAAVAGGL
jgi:hypothetical protein